MTSGSVVGSRDRDGLDRVLVVVVAILVVSSVAILVAPALRVQLVAPGFDIVLDTVTTLVTAAVALLAWARFRERGEPVALLEASAFLVLCVANATALLLVLGGLELIPGVSGEPTGPWPLYASAFARLAAAGLLVTGCLASLRGREVRHPWLIGLGPAIALLILTFLVASFSSVLPALSDPFDPAGLAGAVGAAGASAPSPSPPGGTALGVLLQAPAFALFVWAAVLARRLYRRDGSISEAYLAVGLVFAAFAQSRLAVYPGTYAGVVAGGDLLRLAFDITMLLGIVAAVRVTLVALREANRSLERLKDAEADRGVLEERARLSRELHDGLAQDLWVAKLKVTQLAALPDLRPDAMALTAELDGAIDAGLAEARQAVMATRTGTQTDMSFCELMDRVVDEFADQFGLRAEFSCDQDVPQLAPRVEAELLRIAHEALTNVRRHADATLVRVRAAVDGDSLRLTIDDNGRGFDPAAAGDSAFGLASMRERATLIGAHLTIDSRPQDGTRILVEIPLAGAAMAGAAAP